MRLSLLCQLGSLYSQRKEWESATSCYHEILAINCYREDIYRQRLPLVGSGFSASPVAADGKIYLSNEDGEMLIIAAGEKFAHLGTNSMGELLMATPALSEGVLYVRSSASLFAIGRKR